MRERWHMLGVDRVQRMIRATSLPVECKGLLNMMTTMHFIHLWIIWCLHTETPWSGHRSRVNRCLWPQIVVVWCWLGFWKEVEQDFFGIGTMGGLYLLVIECICICKFWKDIVLVHGSRCVSDIIFTQHHCNPLRRTLPKHLQYDRGDRGIPISTYWHGYQSSIIPLLTHPPWPIMVALEGMRLRLCSRFFLVWCFELQVATVS